MIFCTAPLKTGIAWNHPVETIDSTYCPREKNKQTDEYLAQYLARSTSYIFTSMERVLPQGTDSSLV